MKVLPTPLTSPAPMTLPTKNFLHYYAYGNSVPEDLFIRHPHSAKSLSALMLGCGDLRNMLYTMSQRTKKTEMEFYLNDMQPEITARNLLICYAVLSNPKLSARFVMQLWYSLELDTDVHAYWTTVLEECIAGAWQDQPKLVLFDGHDQVEACWQAWLKCDWSVNQLRRERTQYFKAVAKATNQIVDSTEYPEMLSNGFLAHNFVMGDSVRKELKDVLTTGNVCDKGGKVNPTLLLTANGHELSYALHYGTNMFEGMIWDGKMELVAALRKSVKTGMTSLRQASCKITFAVGHALYFLDKLTLENSVQFDVIETSNLADHLGMFNLLVQCPPFLKTPEQSLLKTCSFLHANCAETREGYLTAVTGLPLAAYPSWLGIELFVPDKLYTGKGDDWNRVVQPFAHNLIKVCELNEGRNYEFYYFVKAHRPSKPVSLADSPFLNSAALACMTATSVLVNQKCDGPGGCCATGHSFAKMITGAFAQQRIAASNCTRVDGKFPMQGPSSLVGGIMDSTAMRGSMSEVFVYLHAYGFPNYGDSFQNVHIAHTFDLVPPKRNSIVSACPTPTPAYLLELQAHGVTHIIESIAIKRGKGKQVFVEALIPDFGLRFMSMRLLLKTPTSMGMTVLENVTESVPVISCQWSHSAFSHKLVTAGLILPPCVDGILTIESVVENEFVFLVKLLLKSETKQATFTLHEGPKRLLVGVCVDGTLFKLQMPCPVTVSSFKIHRKSGFILVELLKKPLALPAPLLSHAGLPVETHYTLQDKQLSVKIGSMFMSKKDLVKNSVAKDKQDTWVFRMCKNLQIVFDNACKGQNTVISCDCIIGLIVVHGLFEYPQINSSHSSTPMLDTSFLIANMDEMKGIDAIKRLAPSLPLSIPLEEVPIMIDLLEYMHSNTVSKATHASLKGYNQFKRCVLHPIYPWNPVKLQGTGLVLDKKAAKARELTYKVRDASKKVAEKMKEMDMSAISRQLEAANGNEDEMMRIFKEHLASNPEMASFMKNMRI